MWAYKEAVTGCIWFGQAVMKPNTISVSFVRRGVKDRSPMCWAHKEERAERKAFGWLIVTNCRVCLGVSILGEGGNAIIEAGRGHWGHPVQPLGQWRNPNGAPLTDGCLSPTRTDLAKRIIGFAVKLLLLGFLPSPKQCTEMVLLQSSSIPYPILWNGRDLDFLLWNKEGLRLGSNNSPTRSIL